MALRIATTLPTLALLVFGAAPAASAAEANNNKAAAPTAVVPDAYLIGVSDVLHIVVWKEPDLTQDATVRLDGRITLPLLGDVKAAGRAPSELAKSLAAELERYVESPRVTVSISQATSARIYVVGQMVKPGEFALSGQMTVLKALALAGGFKEFARPESIVIIREDRSVLPFNYKRVADGKELQQNVLLAAGDTIVVP